MPASPAPATSFHDSIQSTLDIWLTSPEYNYGPLVPLLAALMIWRDLSRSEASARDQSGGWLGVAIAVLGLLFGLIEVLSQTRFPGQLGLFLTIVGLVVAWLGERRSAQGLAGAGAAVLRAAASRPRSRSR